MQWARIGLWFSDDDRRAAYYAETLEHAGVAYHKLEALDERTLHDVHVLLLCGFGELSPMDAQSVARWVALGGQLVVSGSSFGLNALLGLKGPGAHLPHGRLLPDGESPIWPEGIPSIRFFGAKLYERENAIPFATIGKKFIGGSTFSLGRGHAFYVAPHLGRTIETIQLGRSVESDGIGPIDGTAFLDDDLLRAEDGTTLDFHADRFANEDCHTPFFAIPYADALRELWLKCVFQALDRSKKPFYVLWHWPNNAVATAMATFDATIAEAESVKLLAKMLGGLHARGAWLTPSPGFPMEVYRALKSTNQEGGLVFDVNDYSDWDPEKLRIQHLAVVRASAQESASAIRPSKGQWYRYRRFYEMSEQMGTRLSVSKGGRQTGTQGFTFGGCHPFRPISRNSKPMDVYELPYQAFLPGFPDGAAETLIASCKKRYGCFHVAVDTIIANDQYGIASLHRLLAICKQDGLKWITPNELIALETGRRNLRIQQRESGTTSELSITSPNEVEGITILFGNLEDPDVVFDGSRLNGEMVRRYGLAFWSVTCDLPAKRPTSIKIVAELRAAS